MSLGLQKAKKGRSGVLDTYKFKLENGDRGHAVLTRSLTFKLYTGGNRLLGSYKFGCHNSMYDYSGEKTGGNRNGIKFYSRRDIGLTNYAFNRAVRRTDPIIRIGIRHDSNLTPPKNKKYLGKLHLSDYKLSDINVDWRLGAQLNPSEDGLLPPKEGNFDSKFGEIFINADEKHEKFPYWSFIGGEYDCTIDYGLF